MQISKETLDKSYVLLRPNRRGEVRHLLVQKVTGSANTFLGYAKNLSRGGIFISTVNPKDINTALTVNFKIPDSEIYITCDARVTWIKDFDPEKRIDPGMGLEFSDLSIEAREGIDNWLASKGKSLKSF